MNPRILIIGFQRSGTTLLRRLLCQHPDVAYIIHEGRLLKTTNDRQVVYECAQRIAEENGIKANLRNSAWGDKVPFCASSPKKIVGYCRKWQAMFGEKARVLIIVRHPYDVAISSEKAFEQNPERILRVFASSMPGFISTMLEDDSVMILKFEDLVSNAADVLSRICRYCTLDSSAEAVDKMSSAGRGELRYFDRVEPSRAFAYKAEGVSVPNGHFQLVLETLNRIEGMLYEE